MADANPVQAGTQQGAGEPQSAAHQRAAWILTGYGIFGLAVISLSPTPSPSTPFARRQANPAARPGVSGASSSLGEPLQVCLAHFVPSIFPVRSPAADNLRAQTGTTPIDTE
jgi:hypothetical protein